MPIYNVAEYLDLALASVAQQTHKNLEVLMVDDVSTDGSDTIMKAWAARDERFQHIRLSQNGGSGAARNLAIARAKGDYLGFLDGDDVFTPHAVAHLVAMLESTGSDIAVGHVLRNRDGAVVPSRLHRERFTSRTPRVTIDTFPALVYDTTVWNKLFRTSFWRDNSLAFPEGVLYQDMVVMSDAYALRPVTDILGELTYIWRVRDDKSSVTQSRASLSNLDDRIAAIGHAATRFRDLGEPVWSRFQRKVLALDLPLFIRRAPLDDDTYQERLQAATEAFLADVAPPTLAKVSARSRLVVFLATQRRFDLVENADALTTEDPLDTVLLDTGAIAVNTSTVTCDVPEAFRKLGSELVVDLTQLRSRRSAWRTSIQGRVNLRHRPVGSRQTVRVQVRAENGAVLTFSPSRPAPSEHVLTPGELASEPFAAAVSTRRLTSFAAGNPDQPLSLRVVVEVGAERRAATVPHKHLDLMLRREAS